MGCIEKRKTFSFDTDSSRVNLRFINVEYRRLLPRDVALSERGYATVCRLSVYPSVSP